MTKQYIDNLTDEGFVIVQQSPTFVVDLNYNSITKNWLLKQTKEGYVPIRRLESWEIMQAEDQRDLGIILNGDILKHS